MSNRSDAKRDDVKDVIRLQRQLKHPVMTEAEILGMSDKQRERLVKRLFAELKRMNKLICGGEIEIYKID